ncbi:cytochrome c peroxidase [Flavobacterium caeni]|uniref:Cytochrome c peroxidase n=2 Tax=Flavobacterium caeni TaxID=490189 RepID=A0A1G5IVE5_9FLAO|nr:cytochrome c peroxidase [Flavobacterium caeni]
MGCSDAPRETLKDHLLEDWRSLDREVTDLRKLVQSDTDPKKVVQAFSQSRLAYKNVEWALEYFQPETGRFVNGPALDEIEFEENRVFPPAGFQVIEELLAENDPKIKSEILREIDILRSNLEQARRHFEAISISDAQALDALRQQTYRIITLGITGFDSPIMFTSIAEAAVSLKSIGQTLEHFKTPVPEKLRREISNAVLFCNRTDFNTFDRAQFIVRFANPISASLAEFQQVARLETVTRQRVVRNQSPTLFDRQAFDADAFVPSNEYKTNPQKVALGEKLFYDPQLSGDGSRSCATCHQPEKAFTDGLRTNSALNGHSLTRNTPSLSYAAFQNAQFWDLRQLDLEKQSVDVIRNTDEMHGDFVQITKKLSANPTYSKGFKKAFPKSGQIEDWHVQNAIAAYIRTLGKFNSRFDAFMRGDLKALSNQEVEGMNLFMGKAKCATCHFTPLFNGTVPPIYAKTEQEVLGTPQDHTNRAQSNDAGRYEQNQLPQLRGAFKTPTVRNVAKTAPYMHNGAFRTLAEVVDFYDSGGGVGLGFKLENQTLPPDRLNLTANEKQALIAFMESLSDQ